MTGHAVTSVRSLAARIDAATPPHRDRTVDALRALAIAGVILGHWLVTALVLTHGRTGTTVHDASPLAVDARPHPGVLDLPDARRSSSWSAATRRPAATAAATGLAAQAPGPAVPSGGGARRRLGACSAPGCTWAASPARPLRTVLTLVLDPLWFLGVFAG